jgi:hypothetical protein
MSETQIPLGNTNRVRVAFQRWLTASRKNLPSEADRYNELVSLISGTDYEGGYFDPRGEKNA